MNSTERTMRTFTLITSMLAVVLVVAATASISLVARGLEAKVQIQIVDGAADALSHAVGQLTPSPH